MDETEHIDISFVIIGYNESENLQKCLSSVQNANLEHFSYEIIYVDGGSQDNSIDIAKEAGIDRILGGDRQRRAAENRNLGFLNSTGRFIQFIDGDMVMDPHWPMRAASFLTSHEQTAVVCGKIKEVNSSIFYQALQIDWFDEEGEVVTCGGSAMWRRDILEALNGFPETVAYGEEPYLCWRVRNELGLKIHYLDRLMVDHDLDYSGFRDYWRRNVRCGETYAEIAHLCYNTMDRLWFKITISNLIWSAALILALVFLFVCPLHIKASILSLLLLIILRKTIQLSKRGNMFSVSLCYAIHVYFSKLPLAWGECLWFLQILTKRL